MVTFDSFDGRVLPDGNYRLSIAAGNIRDANDPMASDLTYDFFVLAGDLNRDRAINFDDLVILAENYGGLDRTYAKGEPQLLEPGRSGLRRPRDPPRIRTAHCRARGRHSQ